MYCKKSQQAVKRAERGNVRCEAGKRQWVHLGKRNPVYLQADGICGIREYIPQTLVILLCGRRRVQDIEGVCRSYEVDGDIALKVWEGWSLGKIGKRGPRKCRGPSIRYSLMFSGKANEVEIIFNYFWSLAAWKPRDLVYLHICTKKKTGKKETKTLEVVNSALEALLGIDWHFHINFE